MFYTIGRNKFCSYIYITNYIINYFKMDFFNKTGKMALGSRLRLLTAKVTEDSSKIYELYKVTFLPKWFPVFFILSEEGPKTITEIAEEIGHSQPSVTQIIKEMTKAGLVENNLLSTDKRRNVAGLTDEGKAIAKRMIEGQCADIEAAIRQIEQETAHNLWEAIAEWEHLLEQKPLYKRVQEQKKIRESRDVQIVPYSTQYQNAFRSLNEEWISNYFEMEEADYKALDHPEEYILDQGGKIFVALYQNEPVGVCALIKMDDPEYDFEMAKMAVSPKAQGKNIGYLLGQKVIDAARASGASKIYLESNTILKPAISLYYKLGFQKISGRPTPYQRCNIQMELNLKV
ncbi:DNA-binding MarR family transcriptional regulator/GNAT superfamily N-acetyltransferase [Chryseobacterium sp. SORGH_AS909]|uniref:DNA-binding MarR family transcriptional regulator/GNAT superfamily N-acetyltransferase n=2 Tax=Chryseobacterium group TaxID=2782232 RepID=A0ABU0TI77_9FLAO|nr:DNA-binding MarR family transcriptional regulator/GNAT superfamily N-acetyltransferase [Chryseobacterium camelliae]MDQ1100708.1 DNA-binding MarR family transcriptional regulator/GNAT superfamily N-acetyltransferase [Chryseobacterium sp. SORGH_AS_1048]MDR6088047.1 DNA-binding MarR family transcriptional regulator/GNAT superfamily N-acetyltransferase [Chryseobacterium sp. SORGH_AS_0909]MDR6132421.1 DNA-binding MarR family transcriptional regulator/GNAT superfamily N-acetyltransferase [Chryseoba